MQALKGLVIGMGGLIILLMIVLVYGLIKKASDPNFTFLKSDSPTAQPEAAPAPPPVPVAGAALPATATPYLREISLPAGCEIKSARVDGGYLVVRTTPPAPGCGGVILVNPANGQLIGEVRPSN